MKLVKREIVRGLKFRKQPKGFDANKLSEMLEAAYLQQRRPDKFTQKKTFSPSTIGYGHGTCPRYWYIAFNGAHYIDTVDALGIANMANGTQAHERIEALFDALGVRLGNEIEILNDSPPIRGFADVEIMWEGEEVIGEVKTTRQEAFFVRQATMKPSANHLFQILTYMKVRERNLGFLLYENKNSQEFLIIPIKMDEKNQNLIDNAFDWMRRVYKAYEDDTTPNRPLTQRSKICKACPFYEYCWSSEAPEGVIDIPLMDVPKP
jgi:CRISPR/Cas system-associated exonuclease Cas4 (RecB family)